MLCVLPMEHILKEELAVTHAEAGLLFSAPILMTAVVALPAGRVVDRRCVPILVLVKGRGNKVGSPRKHHHKDGGEPT